MRATIERSVPPGIAFNATGPHLEDGVSLHVSALELPTGIVLEIDDNHLDVGLSFRPGRSASPLKIRRFQNFDREDGVSIEILFSDSNCRVESIKVIGLDFDDPNSIAVFERCSESFPVRLPLEAVATIQVVVAMLRRATCDNRPSTEWRGKDGE